MNSEQQTVCTVHPRTCCTDGKNVLLVLDVEVSQFHSVIPGQVTLARENGIPTIIEAKLFILYKSKKLEKHLENQLKTH